VIVAQHDAHTGVNVPRLRASFVGFVMLALRTPYMVLRHYVLRFGSLREVMRDYGHRDQYRHAYGEYSEAAGYVADSEERDESA
jgi:hypothetical protein